MDGFEESRRAVRFAPEAPASVPETTASGGLPDQGSFKRLIASAASTYQMDPDFVASVVEAESGFNPTALSPNGAQGLMQLMPETAAMLGAEDLLDPATNLWAGTRYLRQLLDRFAGDAVKALAAYIAGPQRVEQCSGNIHRRRRPINKRLAPTRTSAPTWLREAGPAACPCSGPAASSVPVAGTSAATAG